VKNVCESNDYGSSGGIKFVFSTTKVGVNILLILLKIKLFSFSAFIHQYEIAGLAELQPAI